MIPISLCLVLLEVYFNWPLESLKSDKKGASYDQNTKTDRNWKTEHGCTGTPLTCTGTCSVLEGCTGTHSRCTGTHDPKMPRMCVFLTFFHTLLPNSTLYFKHTSKPFHMSLVTSFLLNSSINTYLISTINHELLSNPL